MRNRVVVTGPESSGTRYVTALLEANDVHVLHRSQPNGLDWIDFGAMLDYPSSGSGAREHPPCRVVVVIRGLLAHTKSMVVRNIESTDEHAHKRRNVALASLGSVLGDPRVIVVTYESLSSWAERDHLLSLVVTSGLWDADAVSFEDQNGKHYA